MLRILVKFPYRGITRSQTHGTSRLFLASRHYQSKGKEGGGGGSTVLYMVGTVTFVTGATVAYAKYDPDFRCWLGCNVPYSEEFIKIVLQEENTFSEQFKNFVTGAKSSVWGLFFNKEKETKKNAPKTNTDSTETQIQDPQENRSYKLSGEREKPDPAKVPENHPRNLADLELKIATASVVAINSYNKAISAQRAYCQDVDTVIEGSVQNLDQNIWQKLKVKSKKKEQLVIEAETAAKEAVDNINRLKEILDRGNITAPEEVIESCKRNIQEVLDDIHKAQNNLEKEKSRASVTDKYWDKVEEARAHWSEEMEILFPGVNLSEKEIKIAAAELDLFLVYTFQNVLFYQKELKKLETFGECRIKAALEAKGSDADAVLISAQVATQLEKEKRELDLDYQKKCAALRMDSERDLRLQMKRQSEAHADHLQDAVTAKEKEVDRRYKRIAEEAISEEQAKYKMQLAAMLGRLKGMDSALKDFDTRADADKNAHQSQVLWSACQALYSSLKSGTPGVPWVQQLRPLSPEICAVKQAALSDDQLVEAVVGGIPPEAFDRGVFTEEALRERFLKVERIARQVALVPESGGSIPRFFLSYLQSFLLIKAVSPIPQSELTDQPIDLAHLDTYDILQRARYWLDRGDFSMTLRYMNLLKGASRNVACDWMNEARILLETQQAANTLMAHASASGLQYL